MNDPVREPAHYKNHPGGIQCIEVATHANFNLGNAIKYIWRVQWGKKNDPIEDLRKARMYLDLEIRRRRGDIKDCPQISEWNNNENT